MTDLATAEALRDAGMAAALDHAERDCLAWGDLAYSFLIRYARKHATFTSEDVADAAEAWGMIAPANPKAWGAVYIRAARAGIISQCGAGRSRRRHYSICVLWGSCLYSGDAA